MSAIVLEDLSFFHAKGTPFEVKALDDIALNIKKGKITGIIGHTGSGKSTLVQMFNGILRPHHGRVLLSGEDIWKNPKKIGAVRFKVGLVMQYPEYQLFEDTVYKDIAFGPKNMGMKADEIDACVKEAAGFADLSEELFSKSPFDLSGGQKRRVAIAGIIAMRPDVLVLDEPAAGLDPRGRNAIFENIVDYQRKSGKTVIVVSHSMEDMAKYCDELVVMSKGKIILNGNCDEVFSHSNILSEVGLDIPQSTKILLALKQRGFDVDCSAYTVEDAICQLEKLYNSKKLEDEK